MSYRSLLLWFLLGGLALVNGACGIEAQSEARNLTAEVELGPLPETAPGSEVDPAAWLYFVEDNQLVGLGRLPNQVPPSPGPLVAALARGPSRSELDRGFWSAIPPGTVLESVTVRNGVAEIDLSAEFTSIGGQDEILAVGQIVLTLTSIPEVDGVLFRVEGVLLGVPGADGSLVGNVATIEDFAQLISD